MSEAALIELRGISRVYRSGQVNVTALHPTDLRIARGCFCAIMGASGSGKSTLLNLLGMLDTPTAGAYLLDGHDVARLTDTARSRIRCRKIGIIFQSFNLFNQLSVLENVCLPMRYAGVPRTPMLARARELLAAVGLHDRTHHRPTQLSGGQCQRVAIARSLANDPPVLLADEPTGNLDAHTGGEVLALFRQLAAAGKTIIMVTHNPDYRQVVQRVIDIHDGRVRGAP